MSTFKQDDKWVTLVKSDAFNAFARPATEDEIAAATAAPQPKPAAEPVAVAEQPQKAPKKPKKPKAEKQ